MTVTPGRKLRRTTWWLYLTAAVVITPAVIAQTTIAPEIVAFDSASDNQLGLTFSPDGSTAFRVEWDGALGEGDLYRAAPKGDGFHSPERLSEAVNSPTGEWNLWVSTDENEIVNRRSRPAAQSFDTSESQSGVRLSSEAKRHC